MITILTASAFRSHIELCDCRRPGSPRRGAASDAAALSWMYGFVGHGLMVPSYPYPFPFARVRGFSVRHRNSVERRRISDVSKRPYSGMGTGEGNGESRATYPPVVEGSTPYSARRASIGSNAAARRAGATPLTTPTSRLITTAATTASTGVRSGRP